MLITRELIWDGDGNASNSAVSPNSGTPLRKQPKRSPTLQRTLAISKVPTVSILAAMMGIPVYICFELRNEKDLVRSTCRYEQEKGAFHSTKKQVLHEGKYQKSFSALVHQGKRAHLTSRLKGTAFGPQQDVLEVQFDVVVYVRHGGGFGVATNLRVGGKERRGGGAESIPSLNALLGLAAGLISLLA